MDVPINLLQWEVFLPEQYKVKDFGGDVLAADLMPAAPQVMVANNGMVDTGAAAPANFNLNLSLPGQFGGIVVDQMGAAVPNARVTITSGDTRTNLSAATNQSGLWEVFGVPSGRLKVRVDSPGFKSSAQDVIYDASRPGPVNTVLNVGAAAETVEVTAESVGTNGRNYSDLARLEKDAKKQAWLAQNAPSSNVFNLQRRVAGVLPVAIDVPRAGTAFHFVRPLVVDEETKVTFVYRSK